MEVNDLLNSRIPWMDGWMQRQLSEQFVVTVNEVKVGMHQGSALSSLLFVISMEAMSRVFKVALP